MKNFTIKTTLLLFALTFFMSPLLFGQFAGGDGTVGNPYQVANAADLDKVRNYLTSHFVQTAHIDLSSYNTGVGWEPIGTDVDGATGNPGTQVSTGRFRGTYNGMFEGNFYEIRDLYINRPTTPNVGLFGCLEQGTADNPVVIRNVSLVNVTGVTGARGTGALVGRVRGNIYTLIEGCSASGTGVVSGTGATGGLVGANNSYQTSPGGEENPIVSKCYAYIKVQGRDPDTGDSNPTNGDKFGGLVGCNQKGTTIDSYAWGAVEVVGPNGTFERVGGLAGCADIRGRIINSYSTGEVSFVATTTTTLVGGLVGNLAGPGNNRGTVTNSYWKQDAYTSSAGGTMLTDDQMIVQSNFAGFDFAGVWSMSLEAPKYPILKDVQVTTYFVWHGNDNSEWGNTANWSENRTPLTTDIVIIPAGKTNYPIISGSDNITVPAKSLNIQKGENGLNGAKITIAPGGRFTVKGSLNNAAGYYDGIVIQPSDVGIGSLIHNTADVEATVLQYIPESTGLTWQDKTTATEWFYISVPVSGQSITGFLTGLEKYNLYRWSEKDDLWFSQKRSSFDRTQFLSGEGYLFAAPKAITFEQKGIIYAGDAIWTDLKIEGDGYEEVEGQDPVFPFFYYKPGWHLLGNPYPSGIVRSGWTTTGFVATPKVWNQSSETYIDLAENGFIPRMTAFFVQVDNSVANTLSIPNAARAHEAPEPATGKSAAMTTRIVLQAGAVESHRKQQSVVHVANDASTDFDPRYDSRFMPGNAPQFFSVKENEILSTQSVNGIQANLKIPFVFRRNHEGEHFMVELTHSIPDTDLFLFDHKLGVEHALTLDEPYTFTSEEEDNPLRFELRFISHGDEPTSISEMESPPARIYANHQTLIIEQYSFNSERTLEIFDLNGRLLLHHQLDASPQHQQHLNLNPGIYMVRLSNTQSVQTEKIIVTH